MSAQAAEEPPDLQVVLDALDDGDCREIIAALDEPMTATEVSAACDIPTSTTYRKLDLLTEASLLSEGTEIRSDGHHATNYRVDFEQVIVELDEHRHLGVDINRPARSADERLATLWGEVRKES
jgi:DNA-binding IclR family transcriptional regulator